MFPGGTSYITGSTASPGGSPASPLSLGPVASFFSLPCPLKCRLQSSKNHSPVPLKGAIYLSRLQPAGAGQGFGGEWTRHMAATRTARSSSSYPPGAPEAEAPVVCLGVVAAVALLHEVAPVTFAGSYPPST